MQLRYGNQIGPGRAGGIPLVPLVLQIVAALILSVAQTSAQSWEQGFDASLGTKPSDQGWTHQLDDVPPYDLLDEMNYLIVVATPNYLEQLDTGGVNVDDGNKQYYQLLTNDFDFEQEVVVVDFRLKVVTSTSSLADGFLKGAGFTIEATDDHQRKVILHISIDGLFFIEGNLLTTGPIASYDSTSDFLDYQLRIDRERAELWIEGALMVSLAFDDYVWGSVPNSLTFGDQHTLARGHTQLERIHIARFNPPVAEVRNYSYVTQIGESTPSGDGAGASPTCPTGYALAGGAELTGLEGQVGIRASFVMSSGNRWLTWVREAPKTTELYQLEGFAICGELPGLAGQDFSLSETWFQDPDDGPIEPSASEACPAGMYLVSGGGECNNWGGWMVMTGSLGADPDWTLGCNDFQGVGPSTGYIRTKAICTTAPGFETLQGSTLTNGTSPKELSVPCPAGKVPIGGGARVVRTIDVANEVMMRATRPTLGGPGGQPDGWIARAEASSPSWSLEVSVTCARIADPTVTKHGLVGRWKGELDARDSWGPGHGTLENGIGFAPGIMDDAFDLDGASLQHVMVPSIVPEGAVPGLDLYPEDSFSIDAWIQTDTLVPGAFTAIANLYDIGGLNTGGSNYAYWGLWLNSDGYAYAAMRTSYFQDYLASLVGDTPLDDGLPHHIAMVRDNAPGWLRLYLYVDGLEVAQDTLISGSQDQPFEPGDPADPDPMAIGVSRAGGSTAVGSGFTGLIDDVKYYDRPLTPEDIENIAGCGLPIFPRVVNLDAARFGSPDGIDDALCVAVQAGNYLFTYVDPAADSSARFTAWSPEPTHPWGTEYSVMPEVDLGFVVGLPAEASTAQEAFDATSKELLVTFSADQRVKFSILDVTALDNVGGVSIKMEYLPEPSAELMFIAAIGLLSHLKRMRRRPRLMG